MNEVTPDNAAKTVARYNVKYDADVRYSTEGEWVKYSAHAATVAALEAEVERLQALSAAISRDCNECANQRNEANARADAADRRVAELEGVLSNTVGGLYRLDVSKLDKGDRHKLDVLLDRLQTNLTGARAK